MKYRLPIYVIGQFKYNELNAECRNGSDLMVSEQFAQRLKLMLRFTDNDSEIANQLMIKCKSKT